MNNFESRTLALAGVFRAASLVNTLANKGILSEDDLRISVESIFETDPNDVVQVYGSTDNLSVGFQTMLYQLGKDSQNRNMDIARYVVSMLFLERRLMKNSAMLENLSNGVELAARQSEHFSTTHENVIANIADLYSRTISELALALWSMVSKATLKQRLFPTKSVQYYFQEFAVLFYGNNSVVAAGMSYLIGLNTLKCLNPSSKMTE